MSNPKPPVPESLAGPIVIDARGRIHTLTVDRTLGVQAAELYLSRHGQGISPWRAAGFVLAVALIATAPTWLDLALVAVGGVA